MNIPSPSNINGTVLSDHPRCRDRSGAQQKKLKTNNFLLTHTLGNISVFTESVRQTSGTWSFYLQSTDA